MSWAEAHRRIAALLKERGMSQVQLANAVKIHESSVSRGIRLGTGLQQHLPQIAEALGVTVAYLMGEDGSSPTPRVESATGCPIVGTVTAGGGLVWDDEPTGYARLAPGVVAVDVRGTSGEPVILDGQRAILAPESRTPKDGDLVCVQLKDGRAFLKRFQRDAEVPGQYIFSSIATIAGGFTATQDKIQRMRVVIGALYES